MDIEKLPDVVKKFFEATATPATELAITIVVFSYALGLDQISMELRPLSDRMTIVPSDAATKALEFYGISKILPIALLFVLIGFAHGISWFLRAVGQLVPIRLIPNPTLLLVGSNDKDDLLAFMRILKSKEQTLSNFKAFEAISLISSEKGKSSSLNLPAFDHTRQIGYSNFIIGLVIVVVIVAIALSVLPTKRHFMWGRVAFVLVSALVILVSLAMQQIRDRKVYVSEKVSRYISAHGDLGIKKSEDDEALQTELKAYQDENEKLGSWTLELWSGPSKKELSEIWRAMKNSLLSLLSQSPKTSLKEPTPDKSLEASVSEQNSK